LAGHEFVEFPQDIPKVSLEIFLHRTAFAVPFGTFIGGRREPVVWTAEEILAQ
jgi:hypothetical protein